MTTAVGNRRPILWGMVALAVLLFLMDVPFPRGQTSAMLYVAVVGLSLWLPGRRPVFVAAAACTGLTGLGFVFSPPGDEAIDLANRFLSALAIWVVAVLCLLSKRTEQSVLRLVEIVESSEDAILSKTLGGTIVTWNAGAERLFGHAAGEAIGRPDSLIIPPDRRDDGVRIVEAISRGGRLDHMETVRVRKDGTEVAVSISASPVRDPAGAVVGVALIIRDITDRKRLEAELRRSEERFRLAGRATNDALWDWDLATNAIWFSESTQALFGYRPEEVGADVNWWMERVHPDDIGWVYDEVKAVLARGDQSWAGEYRFRRADGTWATVLDRAYVVHDGAGRPVRMIGSMLDITERKRAEEALRESEARLAEAQQIARVGSWDWDIRTNRVTWSAELYRIFGRRPEEFGATYESFLECTHPDDRERVRRIIENALQDRHPFAFTYRIVRPDGEVRVQQSRGEVTTDLAGNPVRMHGIAQDVTETKRTEEELRRAKEAAEAASRAKGEFLANMSHEIRTPMNGVLGMLELVLDTDLRPDQRHYLDRARASAELLLGVINDILDFSKVEAGRLDLDPVPFGLRETLGDAVKGFGPRAHKKGLELALHVHPDAADLLVGDALRLTQVLTNLVGNAVKFTDRGEVVVRAGTEPTADGRVRLHVAVADTGPGIPADKQRLVFEAFAQADSSTARRFGGTGLGLAISARLVELMGGRLWVESEVGKGSTFHFTAVLDPQRGSVVRRSAAQVDLDGLPVLVADDNATNREILAEMLTRWRMRPTAVDGGRAALAELERAAAAGGRYPVVLLDAVMPDLDGFAVARQIKSNPALAGATVLMLSSADRPGDAALCRELGIAAYVRKPLKQSELLDAILAALDRPAAGTAPAPAPPAPEPVRGLRVLLAEDNEVNRELASHLLRKWGHTVVSAETGKEAVAASGRETFDLILMDVQMPEMDGFAATAAIRDRERAAGTRVPIVALTAHAMAGDRERCLAAGMDDYLSKPIRAAELAAAIARVCGGGVGSDVAPGGGEPPGAAFDLEAALAGVEGDREVLGRMARRFLDQCPKLLAEIRGAVERGDFAAAGRAVHKLKGSVGNFVAPAAYRAAARLEEAAAAGGEGAETVYTELEEEVTRLRDALATLAKDGGP